MVAFVNPPSVNPSFVGPSLSPPSAPTINPIGMNAQSFVNSLGTGILNRYGPQVIDTAVRITDTAFDAGIRAASGSRRRGTTARRGSRSNGGNGDKSSNNNSSNSKFSSSIPLTPDNEPVVWSTGIPSGTVVNERQDTTSNFSPLYIMFGDFIPEQVGSDDTSFFSELLGQDIYREVVSNIQRNVNYRSDRDFSKDNFYNYIRLISKALQLYYMVDSILVTCNYNSRNRGIFHLREQLSAEILHQHIRLKEFLESAPIPPNLLNYIRYMMQNHSFGQEVDAPIIRLGYDGCFIDDDANSSRLAPDIYQDLLTEMNDSTFTRQMSLLSKAFKDWIFSSLPLSTYECLYDGQFNTFWFNCNVCYSNDGKGTLYSKSVATEAEQHEYYQFTSELDGGIYASSSVYVTNSKRIETGIWKPFSYFDEKMDRNNMTSLHMLRDSKICGVCSLSHRMASNVLSAPFVRSTYDLTLSEGDNGWVNVTSADVAAKLIQSHCVENLRQPVSEFVRHLLRPTKQ